MLKIAFLLLFPLFINAQSLETYYVSKDSVFKLNSMWLIKSSSLCEKSMPGVICYVVNNLMLCQDIPEKLPNFYDCYYGKYDLFFKDFWLSLDGVNFFKSSGPLVVVKKKF